MPNKNRTETARNSNRILSRLYVACAMAIPVTIGIGHVGADRLDWQATQISTYAAKAPLDIWITVGMALAALSLVLIGALIDTLIRNKILSSMLSGLYALAAGGLLLLTVYEERVSGFKNLKKNAIDAYYQGFHDGGLILFFISILVALTLTGVILVYLQRGWKRKCISMVVLFGPIGAELCRRGIMASPDLLGLYQRAAFACMWLAMLALAVLFLGADSTRSALVPAADKGRPSP